MAADIAARQAEDMNARYALTSPEYRAACPIEVYASTVGSDWPGVTQRGIPWADVDAGNVQVTVNGETASVTFTVTAQGQDLFEVDPYDAVYVEGQWWKDDYREDDAFGQPC